MCALIILSMCQGKVVNNLLQQPPKFSIQLNFGIINNGPITKSNISTRVVP